MFLQALVCKNIWNVLKKKDGIFGQKEEFLVYFLQHEKANVLKFLFLLRIFLSRVKLIFC